MMMSMAIACLLLCLSEAARRVWRCACWSRACSGRDGAPLRAGELGGAFRCYDDDEKNDLTNQSTNQSSQSPQCSFKSSIRHCVAQPVSSSILRSCRKLAACSSPWLISLPAIQKHPPSTAYPGNIDFFSFLSQTVSFFVSF